jgi:hypothetical protein
MDTEGLSFVMCLQVSRKGLRDKCSKGKYVCESPTLEVSQRTVQAVVMVQLRLLAALKSTGQRITAGYSHDKRKLLAENTLH